MNEAQLSRIELGLLEQLAADQVAGCLREVEHYRRIYPTCIELVDRCYALYAPREAAAHEQTTTPAPSPTSTDRIGPYLLLRRLGAGGQGTVFLARDERLQRLVALKLLPRTFLGDGAPPAAIAREIEALSRLDHPHIAGVYDAGEFEGRAYIATRYVEGAPLDQLLEAWHQTAPPPLRERLRWIAALAEALAAAHQKGVIHRDLKPSNIIVTASGDPVLIDFGLARAVDSQLPSLTRTGDVLGTPRYLAPERLSGVARDDPATDLWSLGVLLYEICTLKAPFQGSTIEALARSIERSEAPRLLPHLVGDRSELRVRDLEAIQGMALMKSRARRYPHGDAFARDLRALLSGEPVAARRPTALDRCVRWAERNPVGAALIAVLVLGITATSVLAWQWNDSARAERAARREALVHLANAAAESGRLIFEGDALGRRGLALQRFAEAKAAIDSQRTTGNLTSDNAMLALRSSTAQALLAWDLAPAHSFECGGMGNAFATPAGEALLFYGISHRSMGLELQAFDPRTGEALALPKHLLAPGSTPLAVGPELRSLLCSVPPREFEWIAFTAANDAEPSKQRWSWPLAQDGRATSGAKRDLASFSSLGTHFVISRTQQSSGSWSLFQTTPPELLASGTFADAPSLRCEFSRDGSQLLVPGSERTNLDLIDARTGTPLRTLKFELESDARLMAALPLPDGDTALAVRTSSGIELRWIEAGRSLHRTQRLGFDVPAQSARFALHPEHRLLALAAGERVLLYDLSERRVLLRGACPPGAGLDLATFTPDGQFLIYRRGGRITSYTPEAGIAFRTVGHIENAPPAKPAWIERRTLRRDAQAIESTLVNAEFYLVDAEQEPRRLNVDGHGHPLSIESQDHAAASPHAVARMSWIEQGRIHAALVVVDRQSGTILMDHALDGVGRGGALAITDDGQLIAECTAAGELTIFSATPPRVLLQLKLEEMNPRALRFVGMTLEAWLHDDRCEILHLDRLHAALRARDLAW